MSTYVISDLHGQYEIFDKLLEKAAFSDSDTLYMLGDAIDRGPDGIRILQRVMEAPNMDLLLGNHEIMMLDTIAPDGSCSSDYGNLPGKNSERWIHRNGGNKTYFRYKQLKKEERVRLLEWMNSRKISEVVEAGGTTFLLTHSFFERDKIGIPYKEIGYEAVWDIVWKSPFRDDIYAHPSEYAAVLPWKVVIGHVPVLYMTNGKGSLEPYRLENIINIDGGCASMGMKEYREVSGGILLRLDDMKSFSCTFAEIDTV